MTVSPPPPPSAAPVPPAPLGNLVTLDALRAAQATLRGVVVRTPLLAAEDVLPAGIMPAAQAIPESRVWVKPEMLQRGGAFKLRGAYTFIAALDPVARARGVVAPSSGNHAQAVALAARLFGVPATVVMPTNAPEAKRRGAERLGARVVIVGPSSDERAARAAEIVAETGAVLVPPYDHPLIVAGQGTIGLEIVEELPEVRLVLVPVGGGGLLAGVATAIKALAPTARVVGVEPAATPKLSSARAAGWPVTLPYAGGLPDGLLTTSVGALPFAHHSAYVDEVVAVTDDALPATVRAVLDRLKLVVEPSGAVTLAALRLGLVAPAADGDTVCVLSGGNIEWTGLSELLGAARG